MDRLPEISLQTAGESGEESVSTDGEESALPWPAWPASWQDFAPAVLGLHAALVPLPSLLEIVTDLDKVCPSLGGLWFNFVFDWWFAEPVEPVEAPAAPTAPTLPCSKCSRLFHQDWEVTTHYIETHLTSQPPPRPAPPPTPPSSTPPLPPPSPTSLPPQEEEEEEECWEPAELLQDWRWQDFLPDWDNSFLPTSVNFNWDSVDILPGSPSPTPPSPGPPVRSDRPPPPAPRLKQSKFHCQTCQLTICNACFTRSCGAHSVQFRGTATFSCARC